MWGAFYVNLPISGVRFGRKINNQHLIMNGANVRDHNGITIQLCDVKSHFSRRYVMARLERERHVNVTLHCCKHWRHLNERVLNSYRECCAFINPDIFIERMGFVITIAILLQLYVHQVLYEVEWLIQ